jgi:hypothetical protein
VAGVEQGAFDGEVCGLRVMSALSWWEVRVSLLAVNAGAGGATRLSSLDALTRGVLFMR